MNSPVGAALVARGLFSAASVDVESWPELCHTVLPLNDRPDRVPGAGAHEVTG